MNGGLVIVAEEVRANWTGELNDSTEGRWSCPRGPGDHKENVIAQKGLYEEEPVLRHLEKNCKGHWNLAKDGISPFAGFLVGSYIPKTTLRFSDSPPWLIELRKAVILIVIYGLWQWKDTDSKSLKANGAWGRDQEKAGVSFQLSSHSREAQTRHVSPSNDI